MSKRKARRRVVDYGARRLYREVFLLNDRLRFRIDCILDLGDDPGPPVNDAALEHALTCLARGEPEPVDTTARLIAPVELAVAQLFRLRDAAT